MAEQTDRLRIVHVVESLDVGGLEHMVVALAALQRSQGHTVEIVCLWHMGPLADRAERAGVPVSCVDKGPGLDWRCVVRMRARLRRSRAQVLHTHNAMSHYYAVAASLGLGVRAVINTRHGLGTGSAADRGARLYAMAMSRTDFGVSVSRNLNAHFVASGLIAAEKARAVPNGIDLSGFVARSDDQALALRTELGLPPDAVTFGTVGRLNEVKRQIDLLRATRACLDAGQHICLLLVGDGPLRAELEQECDRLALRERVRFLGVRNDVPTLLAAMDVFVLCSRSEGYSLALVEACAAALPIIATDVGGNAEIVADGVNGLVVPPADGAALSAAMGRLQGDAALRQRMGPAGRAWALREGTLQAMCNAYEALYRA